MTAVVSRICAVDWAAAGRPTSDRVYTTDVPDSRARPSSTSTDAPSKDWPWRQFNERLQQTVDTALQRAGTAAGREDHNINATRLNGTACDPLRVPWANYPLHPVACARLIGDYAVATVETSGPALTCRKLRRAAHRGIVELERDIRGWVNEWNKSPKPFVWTKTADEILETLAHTAHELTTQDITCKAGRLG
ncbi:hypothetical protein [Streptomyces antibioticus]|uniref:hypothetical protein n=1 Tax=Streptomyces antibioticus TaxID=1890 RepID=UPI00224C97F9|nr:hypothetical protein [Streptomyces antibioticus]MCX4740807.1 hypothetical protein [Streptomyces antibioticus]